MSTDSDWPIFVISLADAEARRKPLVRALADEGLCYQIYEAVDGRDGIERGLDKLVDRNAMRLEFGRLLSDPEIGCALSHLHVYEQIILKNLPGALILEDDTEWTPLATNLLRKVRPGEYDFLQLDYGWAEFWRFSASREYPELRCTLARLARNAGLANAYIISKRGADFIRQHALPVRFPADWPCDLRPLKPYAVIPRVCAQRMDPGHQSHLEAGRSILASSQRRASARGIRLLFRRKGVRNPLPNMPYFLYRLLVKRVPPRGTGFGAQKS